MHPRKIETLWMRDTSRLPTVGSANRLLAFRYMAKRHVWRRERGREERVNSGLEREEGGFAPCRIATLCIRLCSCARERDRDRVEGNGMRVGCNEHRGKRGGAGQDSEGSERGHVAGVAIKYNFRGVGLIPRIPRKYFIYYLHFVDT